ncbi:hypothetical protein LX32DRAFT_347837 [Colletotrichum zoysiae]|uniref:Uncharacterized protein n=1 Tax=Colletotrichum zoysiae TaxID=1216348 RepID=A0AAD9M0V1_9PEZI|nr:hypothetical protein LX32DRAFT_347837 [Colletotrichum zoysiae]
MPSRAACRPSTDPLFSDFQLDANVRDRTFLTNTIAKRILRTARNRIIRSYRKWTTFPAIRGPAPHGISCGQSYSQCVQSDFCSSSIDKACVNWMLQPGLVSGECPGEIFQRRHQVGCYSSKPHTSAKCGIQLQEYGGNVNVDFGPSGAGPALGPGKFGRLTTPAEWGC